MSGAYPHFKTSYTHEELVEHFLLTPADLQLVLTCRGEANRCGMALLLKALTYLGYVPDSLDCVPCEVRSFIAGHQPPPGSPRCNTRHRPAPLPPHPRPRRPSAHSQNPAINDPAVRGILNDDQGGPLNPPGLRMTAALNDVRDSIQRNLDAKKGGLQKSNLAAWPSA
jgi:uncharacterized protein DUF4158